MKCLLKYQWVKLPRNQLPPGKGIMGSWARLASRAAFRTGQARYCGYTNKVSAGGWAGGIVGLKSILAIKRRRQALEHMDTLADLGYITYSLDTKTKKLTYQVTDWVVRCSGEPCMGREAVYATEGYGFLCLPRNVTQRLIERNYQFAEAGRMAGSLVPHSLAGAEQCVFLLSASCPVWAVRRCFDIGIPWQAPGDGKRRKFGAFSENMRMPSRCISCLVLSAASSSTQPIRLENNSRCHPKMKSSAFCEKYAKKTAIRTKNSRAIMPASANWSPGIAVPCYPGAG